MTLCLFGRLGLNSSIYFMISSSTFLNRVLGELMEGREISQILLKISSNCVQKMSEIHMGLERHDGK